MGHIQPARCEEVYEHLHREFEQKTAGQRWLDKGSWLGGYVATNAQGKHIIVFLEQTRVSLPGLPLWVVTYIYYVDEKRLHAQAFHPIAQIEEARQTARAYAESWANA